MLKIKDRQKNSLPQNVGRLFLSCCNTTTVQQRERKDV